MTVLTGKELEKRLDHPLYGDGYVTGIAATALVFGFAGWGVGYGVLLGLVLGIPALFFLALAAGMMSGDDPVGLKGRLYGSATYATLLGWIAISLAGTAGFFIAAGVFVYLALRVTHRHLLLPKDITVVRDKPALPAKPEAKPEDTPATPATPALPAADDATSAGLAFISGPVGAAYRELPPDLGVDLRARVDTAVENFRQLHEILHDPQLLAHVAIDAPGMIAAAEEAALDLLRQVPRVARIQALAARRSDDADARAAAQAAFASLDKPSDALRQAVSAAFRTLAANPTSDPADLREHTAQLDALRAAHDEPRGP